MSPRLAAGSRASSAVRLWGPFSVFLCLPVNLFLLPFDFEKMYTEASYTHRKLHVPSTSMHFCTHVTNTQIWKIGHCHTGTPETCQPPPRHQGQPDPYSQHHSHLPTFDLYPWNHTVLLFRFLASLVQYYVCEILHIFACSSCSFI